MENATSTEEQKEGMKSWLIIFGLTIAIFLWGLLIFFTVGDKGLPPWDYSILPDVPGQSAYSTNTVPELSGRVPSTVPKDEVERQHVMEKLEDSKASEVLGAGGRP